jgi:hypothetical protein
MLMFIAGRRASYVKMTFLLSDFPNGALSCILGDEWAEDRALENAVR